jgi:hypothetical protein
MKKEVNNFKEILSYCDRINTYVVSKIDNLVYLANGDILKLKNIKHHA